jgi:hypothetical protein
MRKESSICATLGARHDGVKGPSCGYGAVLPSVAREAQARSSGDAVTDVLGETAHVWGVVAVPSNSRLPIRTAARPSTPSRAAQPKQVRVPAAEVLIITPTGLAGQRTDGGQPL